MSENDILAGREAVIRSVGKGGKTAMVTVDTKSGSITRHLHLVSNDVKGAWQYPKYTDSEGRMYIGFMSKTQTSLIGEKLDIGPLPVPVAIATK